MAHSLIGETIPAMDRAVAALSALVPPPRIVPMGDGMVFRHVEHLPQQAIVEKLVRIPSGLRAAQLLLDHGLFQEQAALQRVIDEVGEDVIFLSIPVIYDCQEPIHKEYLETFFAEPYDMSTGKPVAPSRPMTSRKKIRAFIARSPVRTGDPSTHTNAGHMLSGAYSGYVHAASANIMDMYGGRPPHFHTSGMLGTPREAEHKEDIVNYYYRGVTAFVFAARALGHQPQYNQLFHLARQYEQAMQITE